MTCQLPGPNGKCHVPSALVRGNTSSSRATQLRPKFPISRMCWTRWRSRCRRAPMWWTSTAAISSLRGAFCAVNCADHSLDEFCRRTAPPLGKTLSIRMLSAHSPAGCVILRVVSRRTAFFSLTATPESLHCLACGFASSPHSIRDRTKTLRLFLVHKFSPHCAHGKCPAAKNASYWFQWHALCPFQSDAESCRDFGYHYTASTNHAS